MESNCFMMSGNEWERMATNLKLLSDAFEQEQSLMKQKQKQSSSQPNKAQKLPHHQETFLNKKIVSPEKLKILVLSGNELVNEQIQFLGKCINLIKLDVSHNNLTKLSEKINFQLFTKMHVLHLHDNKFSNIEGISAIFGSSQLAYLTLYKNPLDNKNKIQHEIINNISSLKVINHRVVFVEERSENLFWERKNVEIDPAVFENRKSNQNSEQYYLKVLSFQLSYIDNVWAFNNPIIYIQRAWKYFLQNTIEVSRKPETISSNSKHAISKLSNRNSKLISRNNNSSLLEEINPTLKQCFDLWKKFSIGLKEVRRVFAAQKKKCKRIEDQKSYLLFPLAEYQLALRNNRIRIPLMNLMARIRRKIYQKHMLKRLVAVINLRKIQFNSPDSFFALSGIKEFQRFYFGKHQQHLIDNFLLLLGQNLNKRQSIALNTSFHYSKNYISIRLVDSETYSNKARFNPCCTMMWPSMKMIVVNKKKVASKLKSGMISIKPLSYIKNRDKVLTKLESDKSNSTYKRLEKFALNQYEESMLYFECHDQFIMQQLLRMIYYHNTKSKEFQVRNRKSQMMSLLENYNDPFVIYIDKTMRRNAAAVSIQKTWRRYISNRKQTENIYQKMKKNRAALKIQRFLRDCLYKQRVSFRKQIFNDLSFVKHSSILVQEDVYFNLKNLTKKTTMNLYLNLKISRQNGIIGASQEFLRPILHQIIRDKYLQGKKIGMENFGEEIDVYNLLHFNSQIKIVKFNGFKFYQFQFQSQSEACLISSLIALLTYQFWGGSYFFPLTRSSLNMCEMRIKQYNKLKRLVKTITPETQQLHQLSKLTILKEVKIKGTFIFKQSSPSFQEAEKKIVMVEFYQKKFHDFPSKFSQELAYTIKNMDKQQLMEGKQMKNETISFFKDKYEKIEQRFSNTVEMERKNNELLKIKDSPLNIMTVDKKRLSMYDFGISDRTKEIKNNTNFQQFAKTMALDTEDKRRKIKNYYFTEFVKKEAQKQYQAANISELREKTKKEKQLNITLKNIQEMERTELIRQKVNKVKQFKNRANSNKKDEESEFLLQNNFVMEQQLKMVVMRNKMKERQAKKIEINSGQRKFSSTSQKINHQFDSIKSKKIEKDNRIFELEQPNIHLEEEEKLAVGTEPIINKKVTRKKRTNSIGAYIRDPSFVHGVFPEEYYPIENRATTFFFPQV